MTRPKMKQIQITQETHQRLKILGAQENISITEIAEHALRAYLTATESMHEIELAAEIGQGEEGSSEA